MLKIGITKESNKEIEKVKSIEVVSGKGIKGDRYFHDFNEEKNQLTLIEDDCEIMDTISGLSFYGHTTGQQLIKVTVNNDSLIFCSDLIPLKSHLKLPWIMGYDLNAMKTLEEKTLFLSPYFSIHSRVSFSFEKKVCAL